MSEGLGIWISYWITQFQSDSYIVILWYFTSLSFKCLRIYIFLMLRQITVLVIPSSNEEKKMGILVIYWSKPYARVHNDVFLKNYQGWFRSKPQLRLYYFTKVLLNFTKVLKFISLYNSIIQYGIQNHCTRQKNIPQVVSIS